MLSVVALPFMSSGVGIPSPVGGVPFSIDFAPSILFAILYAILVGVGVWRLARRSTRTAVSIGNFVFVLERYVLPRICQITIE